MTLRCDLSHSCRSRLAALAGAIAGLTALIGCGVGASQAEPFDAQMYERWNSPALEARAQRALQGSSPPRPFHSHHYQQGLAISADGRWLASATPQQPVNTLDVVDLATRTGWRLAHPHPRVGLIEPSFSPDSERLAFVVGLPSPAGEFTGVSALWIVDRLGSPIHIVATPGRLYRHPLFSPDGARVAYARDVFEHEGPHRPLPPENQAAKPVALFEADLVTGEERRLSADQYIDVRPLAYGRDGDNLLFQAQGRYRPIEPGSSILLPDLRADVDGQVIHRLDLRNGAVAGVASVASAGGHIIGMTDADAMLIIAADVERDSLAWSLQAVDPATRTALAKGRERYYVQSAAASPGGRSYAAVLTDAVGGKAGASEIHGFLVGHAAKDWAAVPLAWRDIAFASQPKLLDPLRPPTSPP